MAPSSVSKKQKPQASAEDSSAFGPIAERFRRAGDLDRAVSLCRDGLQKFPQNISARVTLGWALLELGKFDEARVELEQVLRRRPDNLAAIRALAELHDRSEQTLNLPMDGPGQWPPTEDAVEEAATGAIAERFGAIGKDDIAGADIDVDFSANAPIDLRAAYPPEPASAAADDIGVAMWSALPNREPAAAPAFSVAHQEFAVDLSAPARLADPIAAVAEVDLAALIAEAESLEAAADSNFNATAPAPQPPPVAYTAPASIRLETPAEAQMAAVAEARRAAGLPEPIAEPADEPRVEVDADFDLDAAARDLEAGLGLVEVGQAPTDPVVQLAADLPVELAAAPALIDIPQDASPDIDLSLSDEPVSTFQLHAVSLVELESQPVDVDADLAAVLDELQSPALDDHPVFLFDADPAVEMDAEPVSVIEPVMAADQAVLAEPVATEEVAVAEPAMPVELEAAAEPAPVIEPLLEEPVEVQTQVAAFVQAEIAEVTMHAREAEGTPIQSPLMAMERFLSKVHSRRRQLVTESVA